MRRRTWCGRTRESFILSDTSAYPRRPKTKEPGARRATEETRRRADIAADGWLHERCQWDLGNSGPKMRPRKHTTFLLLILFLDLELSGSESTEENMLIPSKATASDTSLTGPHCNHLPLWLPLCLFSLQSLEERFSDQPYVQL